jgi:hypothetical protein
MAKFEQKLLKKLAQIKWAIWGGLILVAISNILILAGISNLY